MTATSTRDSHTSKIFRWLKQVNSDHALYPLAYKLAFWLSQFINRKTGDAWPSVDTVATFAGTDRRKVQRLIRQLCERGHLAEQRGGGRGRSNRYRLVFKAAETAVDAPPFGTTETAADAPPFGEPKQRRNSGQQGPKTAVNRPPDSFERTHSAESAGTTPLNQRRAGARIEGEVEAPLYVMSEAEFIFYVESFRQLRGNGLARRLLAVKRGDVAAADQVIDAALASNDPRGYIEAMLRTEAPSTPLH